MKKLIFLDTETTGFDEPRLVQLAYRVHEGKFNNEFFDPEKCIEYGAMAICHITNEMVAKKPLFEGSHMQKEIAGLLAEGILVAHNAPYDVDILEREGVRTYEYIDTMRVAQHLLDYEGGYGMQELRYALGLKFNQEISPHDALSDIIILESLFWYLFYLLPAEKTDEEKIKHLIELSQQPVLLKKVTFGQYAAGGKQAKKEGYYTWAEIAEIDRGYLEYLYDSEMRKVQADRNQNLVATLEHYLKPKAPAVHLKGKDFACNNE